ncbi:MAG: GNAT family N-acetyltransferase [Gaiellaceae bacterium]
MPSMTIRELEPVADAVQFADLLLATHPWTVTNAAEWLHRRRAIPERARLLSCVAEADGRIVGAFDAGLNFFGSGDIASLRVWVRPEHRNHGIGSALYDLGLEHVRSLGASRATTLFEESLSGVSFATRRGWTEARAETLSLLDPRRVSERPDPSVDLRPARELDPRELHRIDEETTRDMPALEQVDEIDYDEWRNFVWDCPLFTRDGSFGAVVDGRVASISLLFASTELGRGMNMFTGTRREHRGHGLALAVKLATTAWAAQNGLMQIVTMNDETNVPMLAVNRRLGYVACGRRVEYALDL